MKSTFILWAMLASSVVLWAQQLGTTAADDMQHYEGQSCTSIMVGKKASSDGSVITSHTCDGRYRTWVSIEPAQDHQPGAMHEVRTGTMHTTYREDTTGVKVVGRIPEAMHTYAYVNTAYPCLNEKQLAMGETTFGGPDVLKNPKGMFTIEELQRIALQRCDNARAAVRLIGRLVQQYGYGDAGECITLADKNEVWQMEKLGEGPKKIGGVWAAQRIPDNHVGVSANIPRIGRLQRNNPDYFLCSDNCERVARNFNLWDGKGEFLFWKAFNASYANGKNFREREFFILNALAPSLHLSMDMDTLPFSVVPDKNVDVRKVIELFRSTYEGTDLDMCKNVRTTVKSKNKPTPDTVVSPVANPWLTGRMQQMLNFIAPGTIEFRRTVSVAWCSYSHVIQLRDWLPDEVGGVCWFAVDNPGQSPRIPIFAGTTSLPQAFSLCGQKAYEANAIIWKYRKANKLATVAWQNTKQMMMSEVGKQEDRAFAEVVAVEREVKAMFAHVQTDEQVANAHRMATAVLNDATLKVYDRTSDSWRTLEEKLWSYFGMGF